MRARACVRACARPGVRACVRACVGARVRVCACGGELPLSDGLKGGDLVGYLLVVVTPAGDLEVTRW